MDKLRSAQQLEQLQARYIGTGNADTSKHEWICNIHRDSYASYIGHPALLEYFAIAQGIPQQQAKTQFIERMIQPIRDDGK